LNLGLCCGSGAGSAVPAARSCATPLQNAAADCNCTDVLSESPNQLPLTRLLELYCLEDEADVLASNGIKKNRDLSFINDDVIKDLTLSTVSKAKLRKLVKALGAPAPEETPEPVASFLQEAGDKAPTEKGTAAYVAQGDEQARQAFTAAKSKNDDRPLRCIQSVEIIRDDELDLQETEKSRKNVGRQDSGIKFGEQPESQSHAKTEIGKVEDTDSTLHHKQPRSELMTLTDNFIQLLGLKPETDTKDSSYKVFVCRIEFGHTYKA
jgi:hypothetical protein